MMVHDVRAMVDDAQNGFLPNDLRLLLELVRTQLRDPELDANYTMGHYKLELESIERKLTRLWNMVTIHSSMG